MKKLKLFRVLMLLGILIYSVNFFNFSPSNTDVEKRTNNEFLGFNDVENNLTHNNPEIAANDYLWWNEIYEFRIQVDISPDGETRQNTPIVKESSFFCMANNK